MSQSERILGDCKQLAQEQGNRIQKAPLMDNNTADDQVKSANDFKTNAKGKLSLMSEQNPKQNRMLLETAL